MVQMLWLVFSCDFPNAVGARGMVAGLDREFADWGCPGSRVPTPDLGAVV